ncbi:DUF7848 domain-containing protein [Streptomyces sp. NBC_01465]|uniref:DUF7848 domain-containing protein n=1 Tax=Streptomyces sp. NBC_01465 TaxID=2903878 RepID=UPI002E304C74|nr:hypothetical protein [Streptomyces sp. NBC_01465]
MSPRSVIKHADWMLGADLGDGVSPPIREIECTSCSERSEASTTQLGPDSWALRHAGGTRHTGFREIVTAFIRATPAPGNPLHREEA